MAPRLYVGTSGWDYPHWRERVYAGAPRRAWLSLYSSRYPSVEVNATFYHLTAESTFARWKTGTPESFRFCIKGNRFLTHRKRLADAAASIAVEKQRASALGSKLAVVLWQMPRTLARDLERLRAFAAALASWPEARHALEFRREDWFTEDVAACLAERRLAVCMSDAADWPLWDAVTTDLVYVRLHGHEPTYASPYTAAQLEDWAGRARRWLAESRDVHIYFDNDALGAAPEDARRLIESLG